MENRSAGNVKCNPLKGADLKHTVTAQKAGVMRGFLKEVGYELAL